MEVLQVFLRKLQNTTARIIIPGIKLVLLTNPGGLPPEVIHGRDGIVSLIMENPLRISTLSFNPIRSS